MPMCAFQLPAADTLSERCGWLRTPQEKDACFVKILAFYEMAPGAAPRVMAHFPAHRARLDEFHARGVLVAAGPLGSPPDGAMAIFTAREAAEEFIQGDPFVVEGLVSSWRLVEWRAIFI
jgi:uncharacterized protein YciI